MGSELVGFALIWWLTTKTGSGITLAMATMVYVIAGLLISRDMSRESPT